MSIKVSIAGANGRMGKLVQSLVANHKDLQLHSLLGSDSSAEAMQGADVLVDVTNIAASQILVDYAIANQTNVLVGTSGWNAERIAQLEQKLVANPERGVFIVPNFSLGSALATSFAVQASKYFDSVEIIEAHHPEKVDAPSGTAIRTAELISQARQGEFLKTPGGGSRGELIAGIPIHAMRVRGVSASQQVVFGADHEKLTISHETFSHDAYSAGLILGITKTAELQGLRVGLASALEL